MRYIMSFPWECQLQTLCPGVGIEHPPPIPRNMQRERV